jgi:hypothetical protein
MNNGKDETKSTTELFFSRTSSQVLMLEFSSNLEHTTLKKKIPLEL